MLKDDNTPIVTIGDFVDEINHAVGDIQQISDKGRAFGKALSDLIAQHAGRDTYILGNPVIDYIIQSHAELVSGMDWVLDPTKLKSLVKEAQSE